MSTERIALSDADVAYLVGRGGQTRIRLENFSGARMQIDRDAAEVQGSPEERELAKLAISITLQQRNGGSVETDFATLEDRRDVSTFDVPRETVGFLLGAKGATLRQMESKHRVFMFFDNDRIRECKYGPCKRLYVIGQPAAREQVLDEAEDVVRFKLTGESHGRPSDRGGPPPAPAPREYDRPRYDERGPPPPRYDDRYDDRRPRYDERERERDHYDERRYADDRRYDDRRPPPPRDDERGRYEDRRD